MNNEFDRKKNRMREGFIEGDVYLVMLVYEFEKKNVVERFVGG